MEEVYIVLENKLKIIKDLVDMTDIGKCDFGTGKMSDVYWGITERGYPTGQIYKVKNCFKTKKEAYERLDEIIQAKIDDNNKTIDNLRTDNLKLYEKLEKLRTKRSQL